MIIWLLLGGYVGAEAASYAVAVPEVSPVPDALVGAPVRVWCDFWGKRGPEGKEVSRPLVTALSNAGLQADYAKGPKQDAFYLHVTFTYAKKKRLDRAEVSLSWIRPGGERLQVLGFEHRPSETEGGYDQAHQWLAALISTIASSPRVAAVASATDEPSLQAALRLPASGTLRLPVSHRWPEIGKRLATGARTPEDAAVVVGLEDYAFMPDVPYAARDADAFYSWLRYTRGLDGDRIWRVGSGSHETLRAAVQAAGEAVNDGVVWVYYAGHGAASKHTGERLLLGDDTRLDPATFDSRGVKVSELETLASAGGGRPVLVLDTCYAGVGRSGDDLVAGTRFAVPAYAAGGADDAAVWSAAQPDEISQPLHEVRHGAFTYFVVGALRGWADGELTGSADGSVSVEEATAFVRRGLAAAGVRGQSPEWAGADDLQLSTAGEPPPDF